MQLEAVFFSKADPGAAIPIAQSQLAAFFFRLGYILSLITDLQPNFYSEILQRLLGIIFPEQLDVDHPAQGNKNRLFTFFPGGSGPDAHLGLLDGDGTPPPLHPEIP